MLRTDYLIVGAGAMGMAFADTMVSESNAHLVIVDRGHQPGGHWTHAYPFVRLHQPSEYYGVNSRRLETGSIDRVGWNEGLHELATAGDVCGYFDHVMQQELLPTGRVSYFPMSEYLGGGRIQTLAGELFCIDVAQRTVNATYLQTVVPSMRPPPYHVADGVQCTPPNGLPHLAPGHRQFVIIGAGKTGMDVCLWLLRNGIPAERLTWVMPRDAWLLDRANVQPGVEFADRFKANFAARLESIAAATSTDDLFGLLEASGVLLRIDPNVRPTMYRCATVSRPELDQLRRIQRVVRMGHVERIESGTMVLVGGTLDVDEPALYVDCSADGLERRPSIQIFDGEQITLQSVRGCQQVFSAGLIAHAEVSYDDDATKNALCVPVPHPNTDLHWLDMTLAEQRNEISWIERPELMDWLATSRLNLMRGLYAPMLERQRARDRLLGIVKSALDKANDKLEELIEVSTH
jgi:NAD(P)-binding Rossmann-like domain